LGRIHAFARILHAKFVIGRQAGAGLVVERAFVALACDFAVDAGVFLIREKWLHGCPKNGRRVGTVADLNMTPVWTYRMKRYVRAFT
jgi:hypothetical protein